MKAFMAFYEFCFLSVDAILHIHQLQILHLLQYLKNKSLEVICLPRDRNRHLIRVWSCCSGGYSACLQCIYFVWNDYWVLCSGRGTKRIFAYSALALRTSAFFSAFFVFFVFSFNRVTLSAHSSRLIDILIKSIN